MKNKKMSVKKTSWIIGILFLIVGITLLITGIIIFSHKREFIKNSETTKAEIVDINYTHRKKGMRRKPVVEYTVDGVKYKQVLDEFDSGMGIGDIVTVHYDPNDPNNITGGSMFVTALIPCIGGLFIVVGGAFVVSLILSNMKKIKLITNGDAFTGVITDVKMNMSLKINGRHPYKVECEVDDPYTSERYIYSSENITEDISEFIGSQITVYVDKNNKKKYYVDVKEFINKHSSESNVHDYR